MSAIVSDPAEGGQWQSVRLVVENATFPGGATEVTIPGGTSPPMTAIGGAPINLTVTATDTYGCSSTAITQLPVDQNPQPTISPTGSVGYCPGTAGVTLTASAGTAYLWSNGETTQQITAPAGTYTVTVTNAAGCSAPSSAVVVQLGIMTTPTITASGPTTFCDGGSVTLTASTAPAYLWSNGATTQAISVSSSGSYTVTVSDGSGCSGTAAPMIVTADAPLSKPTVTPIQTTYCSGQTAALIAQAAGGNGTYTYQWYEAGQPIAGATYSSLNRTVYNSNTYSVVVTDSRGCSSVMSDSVAITVNPAPMIGLLSPPASFCAGVPTSLTAPDNGPGATYAWTITGATVTAGQSTTQVFFTPTAAGSPVMVNLAITTGNGCSDSTSRYGSGWRFNVNPQPAPPTITPSGSTTFCKGGSVNLTASLADSYLWSNGATTRTIGVTESGSYTVTITTGGCSATSQPVVLTAMDPPAKPAITPSGPTTFCSGGSVTLTAPDGFTYLWSTGATTQSIVVTATGSFWVIVKNAGGCSKQSDLASVTVNQTPYKPYIWTAGPLTFCEGGHVDLEAPTGSYTYLWSTGETTQRIVVRNSGAYSVTLTTASGCSATSDPTVVTVNPLPPTPPVTASGPTTFCAGGSVTLTAPDGYSYYWSNNATTRSIVVTTSGVYAVSVKDANGCATTSAPVAVTVNAPPAIPVISANGPLTLCAGGWVTLTAPAAAAYLWSNGATTQWITVSTAGSYSVTVMNASGCSATSAPAVVAVNPPPPIPVVTASGPTTFCPGGSVTLTAPAASAYLSVERLDARVDHGEHVGQLQRHGHRRERLPSDIGTDRGDCESAAASGVGIEQRPDDLLSGRERHADGIGGSRIPLVERRDDSVDYGYDGRNVQRHCHECERLNASSAQIPVTVNPMPVATITASGPTTFCAGGSVTLTASPGTAYLWSTGATTQSITVNASGNYSVAVTANGCTATSTPATVTVSPLPTPAITASGPTAFCEGGSVTLTATPAASYLWSNGATAQSITVNAAGAYSVTVADANGCTGTSAPTVVTVNPPPAPVITANGPTTFCAGGSVTLTASAGTSYAWSNGATTQSIAGLGARQLFRDGHERERLQRNVRSGGRDGQSVTSACHHRERPGHVLPGRQRDFDRERGNLVSLVDGRDDAVDYSQCVGFLHSRDHQFVRLYGHKCAGDCHSESRSHNSSRDGRRADIVLHRRIRHPDRAGRKLVSLVQRVDTPVDHCQRVRQLRRRRD